MKAVKPRVPTRGVVSKGKTTMSSPTSPSSPLSPIDIHRAVETHTPHHDGEIPLSAGDIITDVKDLGNGWTLGKNVSRDTVGIFPSRYIQPMTTLPHPEQALTGKRSGAPKPETSGKQHPQQHPLHPQHHAQHHAQHVPDSRAGEGHSSEHRPVPPPKPGPAPRERHPRLHAIPVSIPTIPSPEASPDGSTPPDEERGHHHHGESGSDPDLSPSDVEYSSLPTPKRGRYDPQRKPHMVVKPNSQGAKVLAKRDMLESAIPEAAEAGGSHEAGPRPKPPPPVRMRTAAPPGELNLGAVAEGSNNVTDTEKASDLVITPNGLHMLELGTADSASPLPADSVSVSIGPLQPGDAAEAADRDNLNNETLQGSPQLETSAAGRDVKRRYYRDYRTLECPPPSLVEAQYQTRYKPILKHRHQKVADSKGQHIYYRHPPEKNKSSRLVLAILAGALVGLLLFLWMYYYLEYSLMVAIAVAATSGILLIIAFAISRLCRCVAALALPSICTTRGRLAFLVLITGFLLGGPVTNVYYNMEDISRSMSCSAEQTYNQTMLLLEPFDAMMVQLNRTILRLETAAFSVNEGLRPLDEGMDHINYEMKNGQIQLLGAGQSCVKMVSRAFNACTTGITGAQDQCLGVIGALGTVYHTAKDVLDRINPDRWAPKHTSLLLKKRQAFFTGAEGEEIEIPNSDQDICEPLDTYSVCAALNDSDSLCKPSIWAGEAIEEAINSTKVAMRRLQSSLQFHVSSEPYHTTRVNASRLVYEVRQHVDGEFRRRTAYFEQVIGVLKKIVPIALLLLLYVAYIHVKHYMSKETYDNIYVTEHFKNLDQKRTEVAGESLLPLKRYERNLLVDTTMSDLSPPEEGLYRIGLAVLTLHFLVSLTCYMFDYFLYWILALIEHHGRPSFDVTGRDSLDLVVSGEGIIVDLLDIFLQGFHPGQWFGFSANTQLCLPRPSTPSVVHLLVIFLMYFVLVVTILLKAYLLRLRNRITGYFYPEREKARIVHLYNVILNQRSRMPRILHQRAKSAHRERQMLEQVSFMHKMSARCPPCRVFLYQSSRCLVCANVEDPTFRDCETERCQGVYCGECFDDMGRICPLCLQGLDCSDDDDYEELEDDLQPYHRSSKIYL